MRVDLAADGANMSTTEKAQYAANLLCFCDAFRAMENVNGSAPARACASTVSPASALTRLATAASGGTGNGYRRRSIDEAPRVA